MLNIGGGLGVPDRPGQRPLDLEELDAALGQFRRAHPALASCGWNPAVTWSQPRGVLLARVTQLKGKGAVQYVGVATGMNSLLRPALYGSYHEIVNLTRLDEPAELRCTVVGPICESGDVLGQDRLLPRAAEGDILLIANTGAYGHVMGSHYNLRAPAEELTIRAAMSEVSQRHLCRSMLINAIWGFNLVAIKVGVDRFPPVFVGFLRFLIVGLVVLPWLRVRRGEMRWLLIAAIFSGGLQFAIMYTGVALSRKHVFGRDRRAARRAIRDPAFGASCSASASAGGARSASPCHSQASSCSDSIPHVLESWQGLALIVLGAFIGAIGLVAIKRVRDLNALELQAWLSWGSLPVFLCAVVAGWRKGSSKACDNIDLTGVGCRALLGAVGESIRAHGLLRPGPPLSGIECRPAHGAGARYSASAFAILFLGDVLDWRMVIGGVMTLTGVAVIVMREGKAAGTGSLGPT